jgi:hypothetical protein
MFSDVLNEYGEKMTDEHLQVLAFGCLSPHHAVQFKAFVKQVRSRYRLTAILRGEMGWPSNPEDRDTLYFLAQSFRAHLIKELPQGNSNQASAAKELAFRAKALLKELTSISLEIAQMVVARQDDGEGLPAWFMVEVVRDLPRLVDRKERNAHESAKA